MDRECLSRVSDEQAATIVVVVVVMVCCAVLCCALAKPAKPKRDEDFLQAQK